ncbi:hypothetical protein [Vibrio phage vB_VhaP_PG11]|nr:hypothetical protein [Vibrio phage vB_VhaP_PG11]
MPKKLKIIQPDYKIRRKYERSGECYYTVEMGSHSVDIIKATNGCYKPVGRKFHYHPRLRDAIFSVIES